MVSTPREKDRAMGCGPLALLGFLALPPLFLGVSFQVATLSFERLGLSPEGGLLLFAASIVGSVVNIPVARRRVIVRGPRRFSYFPFLFYYFYYPPQGQAQLTFVNLGAAVIPAAFSLYVLTLTPLMPLLAATAVVLTVAYVLARPVPGAAS